MEGNVLFRFSSRLLKLLGFLGLAMHWCACLWYLIGTVENEEYTWVKIHIEEKDYTRVEQKYVWSLYYILTTMTTVGYGDIHPGNYTEAQFALFFLPFACVLFATLMGALTDLIANLNAQATKRADQRMSLAHYMHWRSVPQRLRMRIRTYMIFLWDATRDFASYENTLRGQLPGVLKEELCMHIHGNVLSTVPFLAWMTGYPICFRQLAAMLKTQHIDRGDHLFQVGNPCETVYVLTSGSMWLSLNQTVHQGEDDLKETPSSKKPPPNAKKGKRVSVWSRGSINLTQPRNAESSWVNPGQSFREMLPFSKRPATKKPPRQAGYNIFDGAILNDAFIALKVHDMRVHRIVLRLQQNWRARKAKRQHLKTITGVDHDPAHIGDGIVNMRSHMVHAPSYFGESCLWVPLNRWPHTIHKHMYNARCDKRGELVVVQRSALATVMQRFSPWLPERFEYFRESVVNGLTAAVREADVQADNARMAFASYSARSSMSSIGRSTSSIGRTVPVKSDKLLPHMEVEKQAFLQAECASEPLLLQPSVTEFDTRASKKTDGSSKSVGFDPSANSDIPIPGRIRDSSVAETDLAIKNSLN